MSSLTKRLWNVHLNKIGEKIDNGKIHIKNLPRPIRNSQQPSHISDYELWTVYCMLTSCGEPKTFDEASTYVECQQSELIAVQENCPLKQIDVPTAFLSGFLDTDVYLNKM